MRAYLVIFPQGMKYDPNWRQCLLPFPIEGDGNYALKEQTVDLINADRLDRYIASLPTDVHHVGWVDVTV